MLSEGAGVLVLEELEHAKARGARIYAEMLGYGVSADGGHITQPDKDGIGAAHAMILAVRRRAASIPATSATSTPTAPAPRWATRPRPRPSSRSSRTMPTSSASPARRARLGHLLGASGGVELIFSILALRDGVIPPTINLDTPDPLCDLDYTPNQARQRKITVAMSNSFGFGGHNGSLVVGLLRFNGS